MKGRIDIMSAALGVQKELMSIPEFSNGTDEILDAEKRAIQNAKKAVLVIAGAAVQKLMESLKDEQEIIMNLTDMLIEVFACESVYLRTKKFSVMESISNLQSYINMTKVYISDAMERINVYGKHAISSFAEGDDQKMLMLGLKRFTKYDYINTKNLRREIANKLIEANKYCF
jgi:hypothetical protein